MSTPSHRTTVTFGLDICPLEVVRGYDGPLRGSPEPVIILGFYTITAKHMRLIDRRLVEFNNPYNYPCRVPPLKQMKPISMQLTFNTPATFALVAFALERDAHTDILSLYGKLERIQRLSFWVRDADAHLPASLRELSDDPELRQIEQPADVLIDGTRAQSYCTKDDWIGCNLYFLKAHTPHHHQLRFHFLSEDERNDWTLLAPLQLSVNGNRLQG